MKLAVSNLAIPANAHAGVWSLLAKAGVHGIEVAPTRFGPWRELTSDILHAYRDRIGAAGLSVPSLQAILFGAEGVALLEDTAAFDRLAVQISRVAEIGQALGAGIAVFGAPRQRRRGDMLPEAAFALGVERFGRLAGIAHAGGLVLGLEPVPDTYGGDFLTSWQDVQAMVRAVDHPGLGVHLDTSCVMLGGGSIAEAVQAVAPAIAHFHIAEPRLGPFATPVAEHAAAASALTLAGYQGWLSIEMLEQPEQPLEALFQAIAFAVRTYGGRL